MYSPEQQFDVDNMTNQNWIEFFTHLIEFGLLTVGGHYAENGWRINHDLIDETDEFIDAAHAWIQNNPSVRTALESHATKVQELKNDLLTVFKILPYVNKETGLATNDKEQSTLFANTVFPQKEPLIARPRPKQMLYEDYDDAMKLANDNL